MQLKVAPEPNVFICYKLLLFIEKWVKTEKKAEQETAFMR